MYETPTGGILMPKPPSAARKIAFGARYHFSGTLVFGEDEGQAMDVESHTEMEVALVMLARRNVVNLENQVPFRWIDQCGVQRTHYFDFRVSFGDGSRTALIVKNSTKTMDAGFRHEMALMASQVKADVADRVRLMTEAHLDPVEVHNAELIHAVRQPDPEADAAARRLVRGITGAVRIGDLVRCLGLGGRGFRAIVRLLRTHDLALAIHERIGHDAYVQRGDS